MLFRKAGLEEIAELVNIRKQQLIDEGIQPRDDIDKGLVEFFRRMMTDGSLIQWLAVDNDDIVATAAIVFYQFPPTYTNITGWKGYVTNMYTRPGYRSRGLATSLLGKLVEEARAVGVDKLWLGASKLGRPLYLKFGFKETNEWLEMQLERQPHSGQ